MTTPYRDPAERSGSLRRFYRDWRPTRLGRLVNGALAWLSGLGLTPRVLLTLRGFGFLQRLPRPRCVACQGVRSQLVPVALVH